jgi:molybdate transport system substrate-binding protein
MKINTLTAQHHHKISQKSNQASEQTVMQRACNISKTILSVTTAAGLALTLTACSKDNTPDAEQLTASASKPATLRIAAAANLSDVLPKIVEAYKIDNNLPEQQIELTFASSGKLYAQIQAGAPYDIFLSANQSFPAKWADERPADAPTHKPFTYTQGQLAFYSVTKAVGELNQNSLAALLAEQSDAKITIANPELAPYGESAKAYLQSQNIYTALNSQKRLIQAENIGQAFQYAHTGSVDYGFVAQSQVTAIKAASTQFYTLAADSYPAIFQDGIIISDAAVATDFSNYLLSPTGQQSFAEAGYLEIK